MKTENRLQGKNILIVDDEPDILDSLEEILHICNVTKATNFDEAAALLESKSFDIAILDIMGVDGYGLLKIAAKKGVITVMLTANALSVENTVKSFKNGAASYIPKEEIANIQVYLNDILEAKEAGKHFWWRWLERFAALYDKKFGPDWQKDDREIWEKFKYWV